MNLNRSDQIWWKGVTIVCMLRNPGFWSILKVFFKTPPQIHSNHALQNTCSSEEVSSWGVAQNSSCDSNSDKNCKKCWRWPEKVESVLLHWLGCLAGRNLDLVANTRVGEDRGSRLRISWQNHRRVGRVGDGTTASLPRCQSGTLELRA